MSAQDIQKFLAKGDLDLFILASIGAYWSIISARRNFTCAIDQLLIYGSRFSAERPVLSAMIARSAASSESGLPGVIVGRTGLKR